MKKKRKSRNPVMEFDRLQMFFGDPYEIDLPDTAGKITVYEPSIGDLVRIGEKKFFRTLQIFTTNTSENKLMLWNQGIDWCQLSDFEFFIMSYKCTDDDVCKLFFHDFDLSGFEVSQKNLGDVSSVVLYDRERQIEINEEVYFYISQYLRAMFHRDPEEKITKHQNLKEVYISVEQSKANFDKEKAKKEGVDDSSILQATISGCINHPGFKHKLSELRQVGVGEFFDSVQRLHIYESTTALLKGINSGFVSGKDIDPEALNFMRRVTNV